LKNHLGTYIIREIKRAREEYYKIDKPSSHLPFLILFITFSK
jgi:hypothetical protein